MAALAERACCSRTAADTSKRLVVVDCFDFILCSKYAGRATGPVPDSNYGVSSYLFVVIIVGPLGRWSWAKTACFGCYRAPREN